MTDLKVLSNCSKYIWTVQILMNQDSMIYNNLIKGTKLANENKCYLLSINFLGYISWNIKSSNFKLEKYYDYVFVKMDNFYLKNFSLILRKLTHCKKKLINMWLPVISKDDWMILRVIPFWLTGWIKNVLKGVNEIDIFVECKRHSKGIFV